MNKRDRLQQLLNKAGIDDSTICAGVTLTDRGMDKIAQRFKITNREADLLLRSLATHLQTINEGVENRYIYETDFFGNITVIDSETNNAKMIRGSQAIDLINRLKSILQSKGNVQPVLAAAYRTAIVENEEDHWKAKEKTGFYGQAGAGCIFLAKKTGRLLVGCRGHECEEPGQWGTFGGAIESGETPKQAALREVVEETGYRGEILNTIPLFVFKKQTFTYHNFLIVVHDEFVPQLNWEHSGYRWCDWKQWPHPTHFGLLALMSDPLSIRIIRTQIQSPLRESAFATEMQGRGSYNFPWKIGNQHGTATARFDQKGVQVVSVRDQKGDKILDEELKSALYTVALDFINEA